MRTHTADRRNTRARGWGTTGDKNGGVSSSRPWECSSGKGEATGSRDPQWQYRGHADPIGRGAQPQANAGPGGGVAMWHRWDAPAKLGAGGLPRAPRHRLQGQHALHTSLDAGEVREGRSRTAGATCLIRCEVSSWGLGGSAQPGTNETW